MKPKVIFYLLLLLAGSLQSQIVINEVCSYNGSVLEDEDGDHPDWIELYNNGSSTISLTGYSICDKSDDEWYFPSVDIDSHKFLLLFASGKNRIGNELHTSFRISKDGEKIKLYNASGLKIDKVETDKIHLDHSLGRFPNGEGEFYLFNIPTPAATNDTSMHYTAYASSPVFSLNSGFYSGSQLVTLSNNSSSTNIHYTTDGSLPSLTSPVYTSSIQLETSAVIRAQGFGDSTILPSEIITNTYMLDYTSTLPVFCITTDPYNLWDWNCGIYVRGPNADTIFPFYGANFWQDWEVPAHVEFFDSSNEQVFKQDIGLSINGGSISRTRPMKPFRFTCRGRYGYSEFNYPFFQEKTLDNFKMLVLRNSGGDFNKTHFRDASLHQLMIGKLDIDLLSYEPCVVFLNGKYWGVHNIREKFSKHYLEENYGVNSDNIDFLEEDSTIIHGDFVAFNSMYDFITSNPMNNPANYDSVENMLDIHSFCDYIIAETFLTNLDWPYNNIKYWRVREPGSKWRYMLMDLDISLGDMGWATAQYDALGRILGPYGYDNKHMQILKNLLRNTEFRNYFINRYADVVNTLFTSENLFNHIEKVKTVIQPEMPSHFERWGKSMEEWYNEINNVVYPYIEERSAYALHFVRDTFQLKKEVELTLDVFPPGAGKVTINSLDSIPLPWKGTYFDGVPVTISAQANSGYAFFNWKSDNVVLDNSCNTPLVVNVNKNNVFTAHFVPSSSIQNLTVFPNPAKSSLYIGFSLAYPAIGSLSIFDSYGSKVFSHDNIVYNEGINGCRIETTTLAKGVYFVYLNTGEEIQSAKVIIID